MFELKYSLTTVLTESVILLRDRVVSFGLNWKKVLASINVVIGSKNLNLNETIANWFTKSYILFFVVVLVAGSTSSSNTIDMYTAPNSGLRAFSPPKDLISLIRVEKFLRTNDE